MLESGGNSQGAQRQMGGCFNFPDGKFLKPKLAGARLGQYDASSL
jgi:hypothetical protein